MGLLCAVFVPFLYVLVRLKRKTFLAVYDYCTSIYRLNNCEDQFFYYNNHTESFVHYGLISFIYTELT